VQFVTVLLFGYQRTFIFELVAVLADQMGIFPEIKTTNIGTMSFVKKKLLFENTGSRIAIDSKAEAKRKEVNGAKAFELYDTFGFQSI
jgi:alanyl-tRNA synthetase